MKSASVLAALGASLGVVSAHGGHKHEVLHQLMKKRNDASLGSNANDGVCGCVESVTTWYGEATLMQPATTKDLTTTHTSTSYSTITVYASPTPDGPAPYTSFSSTGVYIVPETTVTLTSTHVVPCPTASTTDTYPPGTYTRHETTMTVTDTNLVYVCPFTPAPAAPTHPAEAPPAHEPAPAPAPAPAPSGEAHPPPSPHSEAPAPAPAPHSETPAPAEATPSSAPVQSSEGSGSAPIAANGNQWAMTYSPYTAEGGCKDAGAVSADISAIKAAGFTAVRLYSTDCSGLQNVGNACKEQGLKVILGVFIDKKGIDAARPQVTDIISWGQWHMVELIIVGNEALFNGNCDVGALASFIAESKSQFQAAGYSGPCTTTETLNIWQEQGSALCGAIDVVAANIHPFFNSQVSPSDAGFFTAGQVEILSKICPGKEVYNVESGWPHAGEANGKAITGTEAQRTAIMSIMENVGAKTIFFSFEDDMWKNSGQFGVEQSWGCNKIFGGQ